jgi:fibronectin type III domain protein
MSKVKLNMRNQSVPEKVARGREIIAALTENPDFPTPTPTIATLTAVTNDLATAFQEQEVAKQQAATKTAAKNEKEDIFDRTFSQSAAYVESVAGDNQTLIRSAGMATRSVAVSSAGKASTPVSLNTTNGDADGEVDLSWEPVSGAKSYVIEISNDPPTDKSWTHAGVSTKSSWTASRLTSGTRYWFRVAAVGTGGQSGWSDPATKIAP